MDKRRNFKRESESEPILFSFFLLFIISNLYFGLVSKMIVLLLISVLVDFILYKL